MYILESFQNSYVVSFFLVPDIGIGIGIGIGNAHIGIGYRLSVIPLIGRSLLFLVG